MAEVTLRTRSTSKLLQKDEDVYLEVKEYLSSDPELVDEEKEDRFRVQMPEPVTLWHETISGKVLAAAQKRFWLFLKIRERTEMRQCRVQFEMPESKLKDLDGLMQQTGTQTKRELFNNAITLLEWAVKERKRGRVISSIDEEAGRYSELHMPILSAVKEEPNLKDTNDHKLASVS